MIPQQKLWTTDENRAVSPVIGVILMVAITVILAAVIGAFVLEIGDQQETAPSTSFDTEEGVKFLCTVNCGGTPKKSINTTVVSFTHAGGDALSIEQTQISVDGNTSVWGLKSQDPTYDSSNLLETEATPDRCAVAGSNEQVTFASGESWHAFTHGGSPEDPMSSLDDDYARGKLPGNDNVDCTNQPFALKIQDNNAQDAFVWQDWNIHDGGSPNDLVGGLMKQGDSVNVVWEASSGGKTQTLQRYTVQQTGQESFP